MMGTCTMESSKGLDWGYCEKLSTATRTILSSRNHRRYGGSREVLKVERGLRYRSRSCYAVSRAHRNVSTRNCVVETTM